MSQFSPLTSDPHPTFSTSLVHSALEACVYFSSFFFLYYRCGRLLLWQHIHWSIRESQKESEEKWTKFLEEPSLQTPGKTFFFFLIHTPLPQSPVTLKIGERVRQRSDRVPPVSQVACPHVRGGIGIGVREEQAHIVSVPGSQRPADSLWFWFLVPSSRILTGQHVGLALFCTSTVAPLSSA